jgi:hypothetical protein
MLSGDFVITLTNTTPSIYCPPDTEFEYTDGYSEFAAAVDEDGDAVFFSKAFGPDGLMVVEDGTIIWETGQGDVGGPYDVGIVATDVCESEATCVFALTVLSPMGCCQHSDYCEMMTELECMDYPGTVWYPPPYLCIEGTVCQVICGDCTGDGLVTAADVVYLIGYLFRSGPAPDPLCLGDVTCDGDVMAGDVVYLISYLFRAGEPPCTDCCGSGKAGENLEMKSVPRKP